MLLLASHFDQAMKNICKHVLYPESSSKLKVTALFCLTYFTEIDVPSLSTKTEMKEKGVWRRQGLEKQQKIRSGFGSNNETEDKLNPVVCASGSNSWL